MQKNFKTLILKRWKWIFISILTLTIVYKCSINHEYNELMEKALAEKKSHPEITVFDGDTEPAMPDRSENDSTLYGVDSNKNELRDDVEIWINRTYSDPNIRMAMKQKHRVFQSIMNIKKGDSESSNRLFQEEVYTIQCLRSFFNDYDEFEIEDKKLILVTRNIRKRSLQYHNGYSYTTVPIGGPVLNKEEKQKWYCKFNVLK